MKYTILVADDDTGIVDVTKIILEQAGYQVITAADARSAVKLIKKNRPDLVFLDIWLAGENGATLARVLKEKSETRDIPIIMISANNNVERMARDAGADDFLAKPFDIAQMEEVVAKYVKNSHI